MGALPAAQCGPCQPNFTADDVPDPGDDPVLVDSHPIIPESTGRDSELRTVLQTMDTQLLGRRLSNDRQLLAHRLSTERLSINEESDICRVQSAQWSMYGESISASSWLSSHSASPSPKTSLQANAGGEETKAETTQAESTGDEEESGWRSTLRMTAHRLRSVFQLWPLAEETPSKLKTQKSRETWTMGVEIKPQEDAKISQPRRAPQKKVAANSPQKLQAAAIKKLCQKHGFCHGLVWKPDPKRPNVLVVDQDASYSGTAREYCSNSADVEFRVGQPDSLVGRVFNSRSNELIPNVYYLNEESFSRKAVALKFNIRSVLGIWGNGVVYEFGTPREIWKMPFESVDVEKINAESATKVTKKRADAKKSPVKKDVDNQTTEPSKPPVSCEILEALCEQHGLCCCIVWSMEDGVLVVDEDASYTGTAPGYVKASSEIKPKVGQAVPGRVWESKKVEHHPNVQLLSKRECPRLEEVVEHNIRTTFAMFEDNRVYEFATPKEMSSCPFQNLQGDCLI